MDTIACALYREAGVSSLMPFPAPDCDCLRLNGPCSRHRFPAASSSAHPLDSPDKCIAGTLGYRIAGTQPSCSRILALFRIVGHVPCSRVLRAHYRQVGQPLGQRQEHFVNGLGCHCRYSSRSLGWRKLVRRNRAAILRFRVPWLDCHPRLGHCLAAILQLLDTIG